MLRLANQHLHVDNVQVDQCEAPTELLLIVRCVLRSGKVQRKLYSNTENYLTINMQFNLMDLGQYYLLQNCRDWVRFLPLLLFPLPPREDKLVLSLV